MANQFYVPTAQYGPALQQAAGAIDEFGQKQYMDRAKQALKDAVQSGDPAKMRQAAAEFPEISETMQQMYNFTNDQTRQIATEGYRRALSDPDNMADILEATAETIGQFGGRPIVTMKDAELARRDPQAAMRNIQMGLAGVAPDMYDRIYGGANQAPAGVREFEAKVKAAGLKPGTEEYQQAALVALGLEPRAGISAQERIANDPELAQRVAALESQTSAAKEEGKLETQLALAPKVRGAIKEAEQEAKSRGEKLSEYGRAQAAMPGLQEVVNKLKTLSDVATYTMAGKAFDAVVKELGFGATEGATARAKMESLVNNQILPLLRDTFGAQFTEREGEQLRKTMLDIDAAPEQKKQILDSFIEQKMRDLQMKQEQAGIGGQVPAQGQQQGPAGAEEATVNWSDL